MTIVGAALFVLPQQTIEAYRIIAQDWLRGYLFCQDLLSARCLQFTFAREPLVSFLGIVGVALAIWYTARRLSATFCPSSENVSLEFRILRWAPAALAFCFMASVAWGVYVAAPLRSSDADATALHTLAAHELAALWGAANAANHDLTDMVHKIGFLALPNNIVRAMAGLLVASAVVLLVVLVRFQQPIPAVRPRLPSIAIPLIVFLALILMIVLAPVTPSQLVGPIAVLSIFLICSTFIISSISAASSLHKIPFILLLFGWVALLSWCDLNDNHEVHLVTTPKYDIHKSKGDVLPGIKSVLADWYESRPDRPKYEEAQKPYPLYVVAAQGGGIYAALHTARLLASLQDRCASFGWHSFAISGVSGGSVGASVFVSLLKQSRVSVPKSTPCEPSTIPARKLYSKKTSLAHRATLIFEQDYLSPLLSALLFPDLAQGFIPFPVPWFDRARALDYALEGAFTDTVRRLTGSTPDKSPLAEPFMDHWDAKVGWPALLLNTTDVQTGERVIIAPFSFGESAEQFLPVWAGGGLSGLKLSTAAFLSARFPWVTPSAWFRGASGKVTYLVDGGYYDNSGLVTALELKHAIEAAANDLGLGGKITTKIIVLTGEPRSRRSMVGLHDALDPIRAMLNTWGARPSDTVRQADKSLNGASASSGKVQIVPLKEFSYKLPLGWRLSDGTSYFISMQDPVPGLCEDGEGGTTSAIKHFPADCLLRSLERDLL